MCLCTYIYIYTHIYINGKLYTYACMHVYVSKKVQGYGESARMYMYVGYIRRLRIIRGRPFTQSIFNQPEPRELRLLFVKEQMCS